jgi:hypothetical protein
MIVKPAALDEHAKRLNGVLCEVSKASRHAQLLGGAGLTFSVRNSPLSHQAVTDLGATEYVLPLLGNQSTNDNLWIGVHERWVAVNKYRIRFNDCGLRLYMGQRDENVSQILRLEWVAPEEDENGQIVYQGAHAGHPHWHIDQSALVGPETYWASLDALTQPLNALSELEDFGAEVVPSSPGTSSRRIVRDCSWLQRVHLAANARWADVGWNGTENPAPHQCEPESIESLNRWWAGALRYLRAELL